MAFKVLHADKGSKARVGELVTEHANLKTPFFMPVGTIGNVKGIHGKDLHQDLETNIILANTYHLYLRPGTDILQQAGGLHQFMNWNKALLTDSGGYQVYSLTDIRKISEEGVKFQSHIDGSYHLFTPENVVEIQRSIGADIMMAFDECPPFPCDYTYAKKSLQLTHRWLLRGKEQFNKTKEVYDHHQLFFPIVQGSIFPDLRRISAEFIAEQNMPGNAIGGLSVGEPHNVMYEMTELVCDILPADKPRYLMGVGTPANLLECIHLGVDMFDCVIPTRNGRNGMLFTSEGIINIKNEKWKNDFSPIDENGKSFVDTLYSKAYLRHLFVAKEMLGGIIASLHNLNFYICLMKEARMKIAEGRFAEWKEYMVKKLSARK